MNTVDRLVAIVTNALTSSTSSTEWITDIATEYVEDDPEFTTTPVTRAVFLQVIEGLSQSDQFFHTLVNFEEACADTHQFIVDNEEDISEEDEGEDMSDLENME